MVILYDFILYVTLMNTETQMEILIKFFGKEIQDLSARSTSGKSKFDFKTVDTIDKTYSIEWNDRNEDDNIVVSTQLQMYQYNTN